ncbi:hypothetical protein, partial [Escherichia coli]|uniref:hypothetical protein n=1 Tax=Escherichia coli TaxID=562 RepID=UPI0021BDF28E
MGSCAAPSAKGDDKFITTDYLQQCRQDAARDLQGVGGEPPAVTAPLEQVQIDHTVIDLIVV